MVRVDRVGIAVFRGRIEAVALRDGVVRWSAVRAVTESESLTDAVLQLVRSLPVSRRRQSVVLGLGEPYARCRPLRGISADALESTVRARVEAEPAEFFLGDPADMVVCAPVRESDTWFGAILDRALVDAIRQAVLSSRCRFRGATPLPTIVDSLARVDSTDTAERLAREEHVGLWYDPDGIRRVAQRARTRLAILSILLVATIAAAAIAPTLGLRWYARGADTALEHLRLAVAMSDSGRGSDGAPERLASRAARAAADSRDLLQTVVRLSGALPDSAAFIVLRVDSLGGHAIVVTPPSRSALRSLSAVETIAAVQLTSAVTSEILGGVSVQRASVRWRRVRAQPVRGGLERR